MTVLDYCNNLEWNWNKTPTKLKDLHVNQLKSIKRTVNKFSGNWFGYNSNKWNDSIDLVLKHKSKENKLKVMADNLINNYDKSIKFKYER